jgi:hypothetical protein
VAYALGLQPATYLDIQPRELYAMLEGYQSLQKAKDWRRCILVTYQMSPLLTKPIDARDIFQRLWPTDPDIAAATAAADLEVIRHEFKKVLAHEHN